MRLNLALRRAEDLKRAWVFEKRLATTLRIGLYALGLISASVPATVSLGEAVWKEARTDAKDRPAAAATDSSSASISAQTSPAPATIPNDTEDAGPWRAAKTTLIVVASIAATLYAAARNKLLFPVGEIYKNAVEDLDAIMHQARMMFEKAASNGSADLAEKAVADLEDKRERQRTKIRREIAKLNGKKAKDDDE